MIECKNVSFSYIKDQELLTNVTFRVEKGEFVALLGANGAGKTTIMKLLLNQLTPQKGSITLHNQKVKTKKDWSDIGYVPQKIAIDLTHPATVKELVPDASLCKHLHIDSFMNKQFKQLSGGQQQRVLVALALQKNPSILLLDEPTVGIDEKSRESFYKLLQHLSQKHNKTILLITHDNTLVEKYVSKMLCIDTQHHFPDARCVHD